jgi:hypothetical protein
MIMAHTSIETTQSKSVREFTDLMQHGDDLLKIELLVPAKVWYERALELNIEPEKVRQKIAECDRLLAYERKVIRILVVIAVALILSYLLI